MVGDGSAGYASQAIQLMHRCVAATARGKGLECHVEKPIAQSDWIVGTSSLVARSRHTCLLLPASLQMSCYANRMIVLSR